MFSYYFSFIFDKFDSIVNNSLDFHLLISFLLILFLIQYQNKVLKKYYKSFDLISNN
jgi:hypothetical protein